MKRIKHIGIIGGLIALMWTACIPEPLQVEEIPAADGRIVVSSAYIPDRTIVMVLTQNYSALSGDIEDNPDLINNVLLDNADVRITIGGTEYAIAQVQSQPGVYIDPGLPLIPGAYYRLNIRHPATGKHASAGTVLMPQVNLYTLKVSTTITNNDTFPYIEFDFRDPPEKNWYMMNVQLYEEPEDILASFLDTRVYNKLFSDEGQNGELISDQFIAFVGQEVEVGDSIVVSLSNISEDYYRFLEKRNNRFFAIDLVSEPFNLPTNVSNGYGFFNLHIPDTRILRLKR